MNPVCVSTWGEPQKYFGAFLATAEKFGIDPVNADPAFWPGTDWSNKEWFRKSQAQAKFVRENSDRHSHFLFTDAYDIVFAAGWDEIGAKFAVLDSPIVFCAECYCWPDPSQAATYPTTPHRCKYLNAGFWMATSAAAVSFTTELAEIAAHKEKCDQAIVVEMFLSGRHPIKLDTACSIGFCMNIDSPSFLDFSGSRIRATDTGETPCLFHGNGNSPLLRVIQHISP